MRALLVSLFMSMLCIPPAEAKRSGSGPSKQPKVSMLAAKVEAAGFAQPPNYSTVWTLGAILQKDNFGGMTVAADNCFVYEAQRRPAAGFSEARQIDVTLTSGFGPVSGKTKTQYVQTATLNDPVISIIPTWDLSLTDRCKTAVARIGTAIGDYYVIHEVLMGSFNDLKCGNLDAKGNFQVIAAGAVSSTMCMDLAVGEVVLGYKLVPLRNVISAEEAKNVGIQIKPPTLDVSSSFNASSISDVMAQIEQGKFLQESLEADLDQCLTRAVAALTEKAGEDYMTISPAMTTATESTRKFIEPLARAYVESYQSATVTCTNELGSRTEMVHVREAAVVQAWLNKVPQTAELAGAHVLPTEYEAPEPTITYRAQNKAMVPREERIGGAIWFGSLMLLFATPIAISELAGN